jgi:hypothetical protein
MPKAIKLISLPSVLLAMSAACAQPKTFADVQAGGVQALTAAEVKDLVLGTKTVFTLANGTTRIWTNTSDGTFLASRSIRPYGSSSSARGTWSVNADGAYCLTFDWGHMETEQWCRRLYRVQDKYYAFPLDAQPETLSGSYAFSR